MSTHNTLEEVFDSYELDPRVWKKGRTVLAGLAAAGWAACAAGFVLDRTQFAFSWLVAFCFVFTIAIGALFFVMLQHLTGAAWSVTMRRMAENVMTAIPVLPLLFVPVALTLPQLYLWMNAEVVRHDAVLQGKQAYLNETAFIVRAAAYFLIWSILAIRLYRLSTAQDTAPGTPRSAVRWSAAGMVILTLTVTLASFDWLMSLDPHWYSTIFGIYVYSGAGVAFTAALLLILLAFRRADVLRYSVNHEHYHDLGKWLFALTVFWAYIAFSQYMLIWYANLPEETAWFRHRIDGGWRYAAALLIVGNFLAPLFVLVGRWAKRRLGLLSAVAVWMLAMHYVDLYWLVMPVLSHHGPHPHWLDAAALVAAASTAALVFWSRLRKHSLAPIGDVRFEQALEFRNV